jgi:hypothetical protein
MVAAPLLFWPGSDAQAAMAYLFRNTHDFPTGPNFDDKSGTLTPTTTDSLFTSFSTNPGDPTNNQFDGVASIDAAPFRMGAKNTVTIGETTSATFNGFPINTLSAVAVVMTESGVLVTGGSGTAYLLPTFRSRGTFDIANPTLVGTNTVCLGNNLCNAAAFTGAIGPGIHNIDALYTPQIDSTTAFQFGVPFTISYSYGAFIGFNGGPAQPGGPAVADFTSGMELVSVAVVDSTGNPIPGAQIHSEFFDLATAPEPADLLLCASGCAMLLLARLKAMQRG